MKYLTSFNWHSLSFNSKLIMISSVIIGTILILKFIISSRRKNKVNFFLYNNGYVAENYKTKQPIYPHVKIGKKIIIITNCIKKSAQQIFDERELWEQTFSKELKGKKIADVKLVKSAIWMSLI